MRCRYTPDGTIAASGATSVVSFNAIWAGVGWPELDHGHLCVVGDRLDGLYHALWEKSGGLWELGAAAVEARERFLIDRVVLDGRDELSTAYLRTLDGLSCVAEIAKDRVEPRLRPLKPRAATSRAALDVAVVAVHERISANYRAALEKTRQVIMTGRLLVHEANCPRLLYALRQPLDDLLKSPAMKSLVWVLTAFEESRGAPIIGPASEGAWYSNISRDRG
jgi:hypothetical protein